MMYFVILIMCAIMNLVTITVGICIGVKISEKVTKNNKPIKIIDDNLVKGKNVKMEDDFFKEPSTDEFDALMSNIENYDGTSNGQKAVR